MSKVYGMHMIQPLPGVKAEDFEKYTIEAISRLPKMTGWETYLLKGERGDREGKYLLMTEIESVEARDRSITASGEPVEGPQYDEMVAAHAIIAEWATVASPMGPIGIFTDYVVVGK